MTQSFDAYRAPVAHMTADPRGEAGANALEILNDGLLVVSGGNVAAIGPYDAIRPNLPADAPIPMFDDAVIIPGLIAPDVHYPHALHRFHFAPFGVVITQ